MGEIVFYKRILVAVLVLFSSWSWANNRCEEALDKAATPEAISSAWKITQDGLKQLKETVRENDSAIDNVATAILAHNFVYLNGLPGGAKTMLAKMILEAELRSIPNSEKTYFAKQMHQLLTEGVITGFPNIEQYLETGEYKMETDSALVGDKFIYFLIDEIDKAMPNVQASLLSVMAERRAMLGSQVVDAAIRAGLSTSNKTIAEFLDSFENTAVGEALLDRFGVKHHVVNKIVDEDVWLQVLAAQNHMSFKNPLDELDEAGEENLGDAVIEKSVPKELVLALDKLAPLVSKVEIPGPVLKKAADIIVDFDLAEQNERVDISSLADRPPEEQTAPYFAANQLTNRSAKTLVLDTLRSRFLVEQLKEGVPYDKLRLKMEPKDLIHLQAGILQGGPGELKLHQDDPTKPWTIVDDGFLDQYLAQPDLWPEERQELTSIQQSRKRFMNVANPHLESPEENIDLSRPKLEGESTLPIPKPGEPVSEKMRYAITQQNIRKLSQNLPGLDYALLREWAALLAHHNVILFGGPGGAKSYSAELTAQMELTGLRQQSPDEDIDRFAIQFNRQTPEGYLNGFPIPNKQLKGKVEYNYKDSQVNNKFKLGIWDEADKAHPGALAAGLGIANPTERAAINTEVVPSAVMALYLTSNALPQEILDSFEKDRPTGKALLDRNQHKAYVINKFADGESLARFLKSQLANQKQEYPGGTYLTTLTPLLDKVEIPSYVLRVARAVEKRFQGKQIELYDRTRKAHLQDPKTYPFYYLPPAEGSTRSDVLNVASAKSLFILKQMAAGVPYEKLRWKMELKDLDDFHANQMYAVPGEAGFVENQNQGTIEYKVTQGPPSGNLVRRLSPRDREFLQYEQQIQTAYKEVADDEVEKLLKDYRDIVAQYPKLFPELVWINNKTP